MSEDLVNIEIDGRPLQAQRGAMIIEAADEAGIHIPRFCYHKKLSIAANCRMCLVEVERAPKPLPACATPVGEGMKVFTGSPLAREAQQSTMEFLLINHPLDCPICDQGGECELQDVAMGFGRDLSRFQERKRVVKDKDIGPLIATDMTRCIHCTRCVRFGDEIAGVRELGATGRGEYMEIGTYVQRSVDSELSGNVIDLCPVGALTSKPFRFSARSWEMFQRDSIAPHDCIGSNLHLHVRRNQVMRVVPRENEAVNETWISDRDRFSYQGLYTEDRLSVPMVKRPGGWEQTDWETALGAAVDGLKRVMAERGVGQLGVLSSPSATLEELYLLQKLARGLGSDNIDHRLRQTDFRDQDVAPLFPWLGQSFSDLEQVDAALIVGSHTRKDQPLANHRLRKAALKGAPIAVVNPMDYGFNFPVTYRLVGGPAAMLKDLGGVAAALGGGKAKFGKLLDGVEAGQSHRAIAEQLKKAERGTVLLGTLAAAHPQASALRALAGFIAEHTGARLGYLTDGANSAGAWIAGAVPHRGPVRQAAGSRGLDAGEMLRQGLAGYLLLGVEPELDCWDSAAARNALAEAEFVVALTAYVTPEMQGYADVLLPIGLFAETSGTYVNAEGRWQSFQGAVPPYGEARPAWKVLRVLGNQAGLPGFDYMDSREVRDEVRQSLGDVKPDNTGAWKAPGGVEAKEQKLVRIGDVPIYAVDPLVRRGTALQLTADAHDSAVHVTASLAKKMGLEPGASATVSQGEEQATLEVIVDARLPEGCALVPAGVSSSAGLGPMFGELRIAKAK